MKDELEDVLRKTIGITIQASGDHYVHTFDGEWGQDIEWSYDKDSYQLTFNLTESMANALFWWLIEVVPALRKDRR